MSALIDGAGAPMNLAVTGDARTGPLQFDQAEFAGGQGSRTCARCSRASADEYFEARGQVLCRECAGALGGGGKAPWWRAALYGAGAALAGTAVWFIIIKATDSEWGLVAIALGLFVGVAVRKGSGGRGGWKFQTLAMALTYMSITASHAPFLVAGLARGAQESTAKKAGTNEPEPAAAKQVAPDKAAAAPVRPSAAGLFLFLTIILALSFVAPFLGGSGVMGLIIIAIALYEAWKINRRVPISGPFRAGPVEGGAASPPPAAPAT
jgi:hypothetical protein